VHIIAILLSQEKLHISKGSFVYRKLFKYLKTDLHNSIKKESNHLSIWTERSI